MSPTTVNRIRQEIVELRSEIENSTSDFVEELSKVIKEVDQELLVDAVEISTSIDTYTSTIVNLIDSNKYAEAQERQAFDKIFSAFEGQHAEDFAGLEESQQKEIENIFVEVLTPLRENITRLYFLNIDLEKEKLLAENEKLQKELREKEREVQEKKKEKQSLESEKQGIKGRMSGLGGTPMDYPEPETFELAAHFPTILRLAKLHDCNVEDEDDEETQKQRTDKEKKEKREGLTKERREKLKEKFTEPLNQIKESIRNQDLAILASDQDITDKTQRSLYADIRNRLEGPLAIPATSKLGKGVEARQATTLLHKSWNDGCRLSGLDPFLQKQLYSTRSYILQPQT